MLQQKEVRGEGRGRDGKLGRKQIKTACRISELRSIALGFELRALHLLGRCSTT
jgi:hypothetical protein